MNSDKRSSDTVLVAIAMVVMSVGLYLALLWAPREATMGDVQRIFYFHVPAAWTSFIAFFVVFIMSIVYLAKRTRRADMIASASAEVGVIFATINITTGPIWAKPVWGLYWTWDARLTLMLVLWLMYVGYLMLRHYVTEPEKRATYSAVLGIIAFLDVPLVYYSIRWWRTQHPQPVIAGGEDSGLDPRMWVALAVCSAAFILLYVVLLRKRIQLERMTDELHTLQDELDRAAPVAAK